MSDDERMTDGERVGDDDRVTGGDAAGERVSEGTRGGEGAPVVDGVPVGEGVLAGENAPVVDPWKRDRGARRGSDGGSGSERRVKRHGFVSWLGDIAWEVIGELVFFGLVVLVSWLIYEEVRWPFVAAVYLGVNAVLVVIALAVWLGRRGRRSRTRR